MPVNSTSSIERFTLAPGEFKAWANTDPGTNLWDVDVNGEIVQYMDGTLAASASAAVGLYTSEGQAATLTVGATTSALTFSAKSLALQPTNNGTFGQFDFFGNTIKIVMVSGAAEAITVTTPPQFVSSGSGSTSSYALGGGPTVITITSNNGTSTADSIKALVDGNAAAAALVSVVSGGTGTTLVYGSNFLTNWTLVGSAVTVVSNGYAILTGAAGKYSKIQQTTGAGLAHVVAKPHRRVQPLVTL